MSLALFCGCTGDAPKKTSPAATQAVLDLRDWDFEEAGPVDLNGEYEFYWHQHLNPEEFSRGTTPPTKTFVTVPHIWNDFKVDGKKISGTGYATYRLTILLQEKPPPLAFKFLDMGTAYTVFANGEDILSVGRAGTTEEATIPRYFPQVVDYVSASNRIELIYLVSNFHYNKGGAWETVLLGTREQIYKIRESTLTFHMIVFGSILIMGLYHLALFVLRRKDPSALYFALFCLLIAVRMLTTVESYLINIFPGMSWELLVKIEYLSYFLALMAFSAFAYSLFSRDIPAAVVKTIVMVGLAFSATVFVTPARIFSHTLVPYQIFTMFVILYGTVILVLCAARKREGAIIFLVGYLFLVATVLNDILDANRIVQTGHFVHWGLFIFIFSQAFLLSFRFSKAFRTVDLQREELAKTNINYRNEIVERQQVEEKLRGSNDALNRSEAKNRALLTALPDVMFRISKEGVYLEFFAAEGFELLMPPNEFLGKNMAEVLPADLAKQGIHFVEKALQTSKIQIFEYQLTIDGTLRDYEARHVVCGKDEVLAIIRDTTEQKLLEKELARAQRLETVGRLAGQIAHDFNNLLTPLTAYPAIMREELPKNHPVLALVDDVEFSARKIAEINQQLLALGRRGHYAMEPIDLNDLIQKVILAQHLPDELVVRKELAADLLMIDGGAAQLTRVLMNLIGNGKEAMQGTGIITLRTTNIYLDRPLSGYKTIRRGEYVKFEISDTGTGIEPHVIDKIFDPFFTTKAMVEQRGTGLGLSIVHSILEDHNGYITVDSVPEQGTTFSLYFPVSRDAELRDVVNEVSGGNERILVVDDDPIQRRVARQLLERLGYRVQEAASGEEAVAYTRNHPQDLLLLDMIMEGIDGTETYRQILGFNPGQKAIILSGYAMSERVKEALKLGAGAFITKPVTLNTLAIAVRQQFEISV